MANIKIIAINKKARFDYEILESLEAGIELTGPEVKSIRDGHISLKEAFATVKDGQIWLNNAHVSAYKPAADNNSEPTRARRLLLKKTEITRLIGATETKGNTLIPIKLYLSHGLVKVEIGLARGKKLHQKKEILRNKDIDRDVARELKVLEK